MFAGMERGTAERSQVLSSTPVMSLPWQWAHAEIIRPLSLSLASLHCSKLVRQWNPVGKLWTVQNSSFFLFLPPSLPLLSPLVIDDDIVNKRNQREEREREKGRRTIRFRFCILFFQKKKERGSHCSIWDAFFPTSFGHRPVPTLSRHHVKHSHGMTSISTCRAYQ